MLLVMRRSRSFRVIWLLVLGGLGTAALWAFWIEPASLRNQDVTLRLPRWPQACDGLRVAVLGDLHVGSPFNGLVKLRRVVELTNAAEPDVSRAAPARTPPESVAAAAGGRGYAAAPTSGANPPECHGQVENADVSITAS
jgi:hypothetical protein